MIQWPDFPQVGTLKMNGCKVIYSLDDTGPNKFGKLKHASVSRQHDLPTWNQMKMVKEKLFGDIDVMMLLPRIEDYVNLHPNCLHLWECPSRWGMQ